MLERGPGLCLLDLRGALPLLPTCIRLSRLPPCHRRRRRSLGARHRASPALCRHPCYTTPGGAKDSASACNRATQVAKHAWAYGDASHDCTMTPRLSHHSAIAQPPLIRLSHPPRDPSFLNTPLKNGHLKPCENTTRRRPCTRPCMVSRHRTRRAGYLHLMTYHLAATQVFEYISPSM